MVALINYTRGDVITTETTTSGIIITYRKQLTNLERLSKMKQTITFRKSIASERHAPQMAHSPGPH